MIAAALLFIFVRPAPALEITPFYRLQVMGGQYFFAGSKGTLSGNAAGSVAPAMRFNDQWALLPSVQSSYQGTKQVKDIVGSGTMFQEQMDHRFSARAIYSPRGSRWRLKPNFSFKYEMLKETRDESWGGGLFDYQKWCFGLEAEYLWREPFSWRFGADYYELDFPNYSSLESRAAFDFQGQSLARELVGARVLDSQNLGLSLSVDGPVRERLVLDGGLRMTLRRFPEQRVVDPVGSLTATARADVFTELNLSARMPADFNRGLRALGSLDLSLAYNSSNQNNYDAANARYFGYYYNYGELRLGPSLKVLAGPAARPVTTRFSFSWWQRRYPYRRVQDAAGVYGNGGLRASGWMTDVSLSYPMARRLSLLVDLQYGQSASNQKFEQFYRYNYAVANYLFGFSYEY
ncbi:MAG TPA: hypothetical protein DEB40_07130 [Elusimicrobia bacterium]|nr:hypothetical protein [Elusimicrobiota bacterium]HBT61501.1 hypothetical protein [Elusimicrobiota bacterium]